MPGTASAGADVRRTGDAHARARVAGLGVVLHDPAPRPPRQDRGARDRTGVGTWDPGAGFYRYAKLSDGSLQLTTWDHYTTLTRMPRAKRGPSRSVIFLSPVRLVSLSRARAHGGVHEHMATVDRPLCDRAARQRSQPRQLLAARRRRVDSRRSQARSVRFVSPLALMPRAGGR